MVNECPISVERVDERSARASGVVAVGVVVLVLATPYQWPLAALAADFFLRAFVGPRSSPLSWLLRRGLAVLGVRPRPIDAAPKRFAAGVGFVFSAVSFGLWAAGLPFAAAGVAAVLGACAALEGFVGFCIGCRVYTLLLPWLPKARPAGSTP